MANNIDQILEAARQEAARIDRSLTKSSSYAEIASAYLKAGLKSQCLEVLAEGLKTADTLKKPEEKARQLAWLARILAAAGEIEKAREQISRAVLLAGATETSAQKIDALYQIACDYADAGLKEEAGKVISTLRQQVVIPENEVDSACELINLAELYENLGQLELADEVLREAHEIAGGLKDNWFKAERLVEICEVYVENAQLKEKAIPVLPEAQAVAASINEGNRPYFLLRIVDVLKILDKTTSARELLQQTLELVGKEEPISSRISDLLEIAESYGEMGDATSASGVLDQAKILNKGLADAKDLTSNLLSIGRIQGELGLQEKALETAAEALDSANRISDRKSLLYTLGNATVLYAGLKNNEKVQAAVNRILSLLAENPGKTSGLGSIVIDLAEAGETDSALKLVAVVHEPEIKASALVSIAESLLEKEKAGEH